MSKRRKDRTKGGSAKPETVDTAPAEESAAERSSDPRARLGEMLVQEGIITDGQLSEALKHQREHGGFLGNVLISLNHIDQNALVSFLVKQCKIPHISLLDYSVNEDLFKLVPKELCHKHLCIPIDRLGKILTVAMVDPFNVEALESVRCSCPDIKIKPILCDYNHFDQVARKHLSAAESDESITQDVSAQSFGLAAAPPKSAEKKVYPAPTGRKAHQIESKLNRGNAPAAPEMDLDALQSRIEDAVAGAIGAAMAPLISTIESMQRSLAERREADPDMSNVEPFPVPERAEASAPKRDQILTASGVTLSGSELVRSALLESPASAAYAFDNFVAGSANKVTESLLRGLAASSGKGISPLYLCAGVGLGKTHLLHAAGNEFTAANPDARVCRMTGGMFARGCDSANSGRGIRTFLESISTVDLFLCDDIHTLAGHTEAQAAFVEVFDAFSAAARPLVIAGLMPDGDGTSLDLQLASRLNGAVVAAVKPPEFEARIEILRQIAEIADVDISDEIIALVAERVKNDVRRLKGAFEKVAAYTRVADGGVSADEAREMIVQFNAEAVA